jgi:hypothetical protein
MWSSHISTLPSCRWFSSKEAQQDISAAETSGTASTRTRNNTKKKLTMDEFFEHLGKQQQHLKKTKQKHRGDKSRPILQQTISRLRSSSDSLSSQPAPSTELVSVVATLKSETQSSSPTTTTTTTTTPPRTDMTSFFDQVDAIIAENKRRKNSNEIISSATSDSAIKSKDNESMFLDRLSPNVIDTDETSTTRRPLPVQKYDHTTLQGQYLELLDDAMDDPKFLRRHTSSPIPNELATPVIDWLKSTEPSIDINLPMLQKAVQGNMDKRNSNGNNSSDSNMILPEEPIGNFRQELANQRDRFLQHHGWNNKQYMVATITLIRIGNLCAQHSTAPPLQVAWSKLKETGFFLDKDILHNYLYVSTTFSLPSARRLSSLSSRLLLRNNNESNSAGSVLDFLDGLSDTDTLSSSSSSSQDDDNDNDTESYEGCGVAIDLAAEVALCHNFLFEPTEQSTMIHVRVLVAQNRPNEAERLLDSCQVSAEQVEKDTLITV